MELKPDQELESVDQDPLLLVFLDLRKAYDNLDWGRLLNTLEGYGVGQKLRRLLTGFWSRQEVVTRQNGLYAPQVRATIRMTQGGLASTTLLNMELYSGVIHWM